MNECSLLSFHCGTWMNWWTPECFQAHQLVHILRVVYYGQPGFMAFLPQGFHGNSQHCFGSWCWAESRKMLLLQDLFPLQWARRPWRLQQNMLMALFHEFVMLVDSQWLHCRYVISHNAFSCLLTWKEQGHKLFVFLNCPPPRSELMVKPLMAAWGCWGLSSLLIWASFRLAGAGDYPKSTKYKAWPRLGVWTTLLLTNERGWWPSLAPKQVICLTPRRPLCFAAK